VGKIKLNYLAFDFQQWAFGKTHVKTLCLVPKAHNLNLILHDYLSVEIFVKRAMDIPKKG
jgi:hypothetical protein